MKGDAPAGAPAMSAPIAASEIWTAVMDLAGFRCQCTWRRHPAHRGDEGGRCEQTTDAVRLISAPADPGPCPDRKVVSLPVEELRAWCPGCWDEAVKVARRRARAVERIAHRDGLLAGLFDMEATR